MALMNYETGESIHDEGKIAERLVGALADAARDSDTGAVCAAWDGEAWDYVDPRDAVAARARGEEVAVVFDDELSAAEEPVEIGSVTREWLGDEEEPDDLSAYVQVEVTVDGKSVTVGTMIGVPESQQGQCRASGAGVRPFLSAWCVDDSDLEGVPRDRRDDVRAELANVASRLWYETTALRDAGGS